MGASDNKDSNDGNVSNSTVELEVSQTPPRMTLRSHSHQRTTDGPGQSQNNKSTDAGTSAQPKAMDGAETEAVGYPEEEPEPKRHQRKKRKKAKTKPTFQLLTQRSMRRDQVDEQCRCLNIKYRRWSGTTEPKDFLHKSHCDFTDHNDYVPRGQVIPGDCILCPTKKYLKDNWDKQRHYRGKHQEKLLVMNDTIMLQCKCSDVRSQGWDRDHSLRNSHYHCSVCHWPWDKPSQIKNHLRALHGKMPSEVQHLRAIPKRGSK